MTTTTTPRTITAKQADLIRSLLNAKDVDADVAADIRTRFFGPDAPTTREASKVIDYLMARPRRATTNPGVTPGMYSVNGIVLRVQEGRDSGRLYAKRLVTTGRRARFVYVPDAMRVITAEHRMTDEQAAAFGIETGVCCVCAATLTDPASIARGIGPVCATRI